MKYIIYQRDKGKKRWLKKGDKYSTLTGVLTDVEWFKKVHANTEFKFQVDEKGHKPNGNWRENWRTRW